MPRKPSQTTVSAVMAVLGRRGGSATSSAKTASSRANAAKPRKFRLGPAGALEMRVAGTWRPLKPPYDVAARRWLARHR